MSVMQHMFYGSFGMQNTMVAFIFRFDPREGQYKVKLDKKGQFFKITMFILNMPFLSSFVSGFQKRLILRMAIRNAKNCI